MARDDTGLAELVCPDDGTGPLLRSPGAHGEEDALECPGCGRSFSSRGRVLRLLPRGLDAVIPGGDAEAEAPVGPRDISLRVSEARVRDDESALYDDLYPDREYRHELDTYVRMLDPQRDDQVLDVGAGTGRVVKEYAARCARVTCVDLSSESLRRLLGRTDLERGKVRAVQADAASLPFRDGTFDRAAALSIVCFLPTESLRERFLAELGRVLVPGGVLVISTYHLAVVKRLWAALGRTEGALREGFQNGGRVFYRNETRKDFESALERRFRVHEVRGVCHRVPVISRLSTRLSRGLDGLLGRIPAALPVFATEIVARCTKP